MAEQSLETPPAEPAAAPAVPAPAEGAAAAEAPAAPTGTSDAIAAARERIAEGKPVVEGAEPPAGEGDPPPVKEGEAPPPGEGEAPPAGEGEAPPAKGEDPPPEPTAEEAAAAAAAAAAEPQPEAFVVTLPGLEERGEEPIELETSDKETFERINRLKNGYQTGQQIKAGHEENARKAADLSEVEDAIAIDPTGFVLEHIPEQLRSEIAMQLLFEPSVLSQIKEQLGAGDNPTSLAEIIESPDALRITQAELKADRLELRDKLRVHNEDQKAMRANGEAIAAEIQNLIPEEITGSKRSLLFGDAIRDVKDRCDRLKLRKLDPRDVKLIVADRFREQGIDFARPRTKGEGSSSARAAPAPGQPAAATAGGERTGPELVQARAVKRAAAASAPAGAGAPAAQPRPELPPTTEERIKLARKVGLRQLLGRS